MVLMPAQHGKAPSKEPALIPATPTPLDPPARRVAARAAQHHLVARGLTLRTRNGTVFAPVDLDLPAHTPLAVLGTQGSGRSALLLALTGRLQGVDGELTLGRIDGVRHAHRLREATAVAHVSDLVELESTLTVRESLEERILTDGIRRRDGRARFARLSEAVGFEADPGTPVGHLPAPERTVLTALLACLRPARLVAYDDVDATLTDAQLARVCTALETLGDFGHPFAVSALTSSAVPRGAVVLPLTPSLED